MPSSDAEFPTDGHGWAELLPPREVSPPLSGQHRAAWAVVGAGVTGLACARRLAERHPDQEIILQKMGRVRDAGVAPDGAIYIVTNGPDRVLKLLPKF